MENFFGDLSLKETGGAKNFVDLLFLGNNVEFCEIIIHRKVVITARNKNIL